MNKFVIGQRVYTHFWKQMVPGTYQKIYGTIIGIEKDYVKVELDESSKLAINKFPINHYHNAPNKKFHYSWWKPISPLELLAMATKEIKD